MDGLTLTTNGKVDRKALPTHDQSRTELARDYVAPRSRMEQQLADILREVLRVEKVGVHDNFFDLGGHSLLATQVVARLRDLMRVELPLRQLFEHPTVAGIAEVIARRLSNEPGVAADHFIER